MQNEEREEGNSNMGRKKKKIECNVASFSLPPVIFLLEILYEWIRYIKIIQ